MPGLSDKFYFPMSISGSWTQLSKSLICYTKTSTPVSNWSVNTFACSYREGKEDSRVTE